MFKFISNLRFLGLVIALLALYVILNKVVIPFTYDMAKSDVYLDGSEDSGSRYATSSDLTDTAFKHCNTYIKDELGDDVALNFAAQPINVWDIGSYTFVVNADVEIQNKDGASTMRKYVCRIKYDEGDKSDINNWSVYGVTGIDEL